MLWPIVCITIIVVYGEVSKFRGRLRLATTGNPLKCVIHVGLLTFENLHFDMIQCVTILFVSPHLHISVT